MKLIDLSNLQLKVNPKITTSIIIQPAAALLINDKTIKYFVEILYSSRFQIYRMWCKLVAVCILIIVISLCGKIYSLTFRYIPGYTLKN